MIAVDIRAGDRRGRLLTRDVAPSEKALERASREYLKPEDLERVAPLRATLTEPVVVADAHPTSEDVGVLQVFVRSSEGPLFATTVVSERVVEDLLRTEPTVLEDFSLQVAPLETMTSDSLRVAVERWIERNFPGLALPVIEVVPWTDTEKLSRFDDLVSEIAARTTTVEGEFPETLTAIPGEAA